MNKSKTIKMMSKQLVEVPEGKHVHRLSLNKGKIYTAPRDIPLDVADKLISDKKAKEEKSNGI